MKRIIALVPLAYVALCVLFVGANQAFWPRSDGSVWHFTYFRRNSAQTFGGLVPKGLRQPDHVLLKSHVDLLPAVAFLRELGNSFRLALGQSPDWVFTGGRDSTALFLTGELWVSRGASPRIENELERVAGIIGTYNQQLENEGWKLIVLPVPTKLGIQREWAQWPVGGQNLLSRDPLVSDRSDEVYQSFLRSLAKRHVATVNLQGIYRDALAKNSHAVLYPPNESHWSGEGISLAAAATARVISSSSRLKDRSPDHPTFYVERHVGDLVKAFDPLPIFTTRLHSIWTYEDRLMDGEEKRGYPVHMDPAGLVVALGTSYTGQYTWIPHPVGFAWQLGLHLENAEVQNRPMAGQGSFKSFEYFWEHRKEIADDFALREGAGKERIVVWEMPIRDIPGIGVSTLSWQANVWY